MAQIKLPPLHTNQQVIWNSPARFKVISAGRRFGKSRLALTKSLNAAINEGKQIWWLSPSHRTSGSQWRTTLNLLNGRVFTYKNEQERRLEFKIDGRHGELTFLSADRYDNLRGDGLDGVIIDEAAYCNPSVWTEVIRPALVDKQGFCWFISTPKGKNWFYKLYTYAEREDTPDWEAFHFTSYDNKSIPHIRQEIDMAKQDMPAFEFKQEHLAEFVDDVGALFTGIEKVAINQRIEAPIQNHVYVMGCDLGRKHDATVYNVLDITTGRQVYIRRFTETGWTLQKERLKALIDTFHPVKVFVEENSFGQPFIESLIEEGVKNIEPVYMHAFNKGPIIESLAVAIDRQDITLLSEDDPDGQRQAYELRAYEMNQRNGRWVYGAPYGVMDDMVISLALANWGMKNRPKPVEFAVNPFYKGHVHASSNRIFRPEQFETYPIRITPR